jgi:hypothetical protein
MIMRHRNDGGWGLDVLDSTAADMYSSVKDISLCRCDCLSFCPLVAVFWFSVHKKPESKLYTDLSRWTQQKMIQLTRTYSTQLH